jgi:hypothetical protein
LNESEPIKSANISQPAGVCACDQEERDTQLHPRPAQNSEVRAGKTIKYLKIAVTSLNHPAEMSNAVVVGII